MNTGPEACDKDQIFNGHRAGSLW